MNKIKATVLKVEDYPLVKVVYLDSPLGELTVTVVNPQREHSYIHKGSCVLFLFKPQDVILSLHPLPYPNTWSCRILDVKKVEPFVEVRLLCGSEEIKALGLLKEELSGEVYACLLPIHAILEVLHA